MNTKEILLLQLENNFGLSIDEKELLGGRMIEVAEEKTIISLGGFEEKYFEGKVNPFISTVYGQFLYWLSKIIAQKGHQELGNKLFCLNKMLNSVDLFYEIELPTHWSCAHPLGSIMGRAKYGDFFYFFQGCTVGQNRGDDFPVIEDHVTMYANSMILGNCVVGRGSVISAGSKLINAVVPDNSIVFGSSPNLVIKKQSKKL